MPSRLFRINRPLQMTSRSLFMLGDKRERAKIFDCTTLIKEARITVQHRADTLLRVWSCSLEKRYFYADICGFMYSDYELLSYERSGFITEIFEDQLR